MPLPTGLGCPEHFGGTTGYFSVSINVLLFAGDVKFAEIKMENGRSKGVGVVRFTNPELAKRAVGILSSLKTLIDTPKCNVVSLCRHRVIKNILIFVAIKL